MCSARRQFRKREPTAKARENVDTESKTSYRNNQCFLLCDFCKGVTIASVCLIYSIRMVSNPFCILCNQTSHSLPLTGCHAIDISWHSSVYPAKDRTTTFAKSQTLLSQPFQLTDHRLSIHPALQITSCSLVINNKQDARKFRCA
jgi:hypothetical protein